MVTVKARTVIKLDPVRRVPGGIEVRGVVTDTGLRAPVQWATLNVQLDDRRDWTNTDDEGEFSILFPVTEGVHDLRVNYAGDRTYAAADAELLGFDVTKQPIALTLRVPRELETSAEALEVVVRARTETDPVAVDVGLYVGEAGKKSARMVGRVTTDDKGRGTTSIPVSELGDAGRKRIEARFAGSDAYDVAVATAEVLLATETTLELSLSHRTIKFEDKLKASGLLLDEAGKPIAGASIGLLAGKRRVADALTNDAGRFTLSVEGSELGQGKTNVQAVFASPESFRKSSRSTPVAVTVRDPQPVPMGYTIAAFAATASAVVLFVLLRTRPWESLLAKLRRGDADIDDGTSDKPRPSTIEDLHTGLVQARPSLVSTLRRAQDFGFSGILRDAVTGRPLAGAELVLVCDHQPERRSETGPDGRFDADALTPGVWTAVASCRAYVTERFDVTIPHRGELRGARIDLMPVRERIFRIYRDAALPMLPDPEQWGIWTPRELFAYVRDQRPAAALAALTDFVEENYFSQRLPEEDILELARARASDAQAETPPPGVSGPAA